MRQTPTRNGVWRWHFYAGVITLPFLVLLAITGMIYLFADEIDALSAGSMDRASAPASAQITDPLAPERWVRAAEVGTGGRASQLVMPADPARAARITIEHPDGRLTAFVDPATAQYQGAMSHGGVMATVRDLHSLSILGPFANALIEVVAGWAIVLVVTGIFLWWPRKGQDGGVVSIRGTTRQRIFWRDVHAVTGAVVGVVIAFLAITGMPWSIVWGDGLRQVINHMGWGRPAVQGLVSTGEHQGHDHAEPWTVQGTAMTSHAPHTASLDQVIAEVEAAALPRPWTLTLAPRPGEAIRASHTGRQVEATRILHLDPASARVVSDIGYGDFGPGARAVEWGIAVHQGTQYGEINRIIMLIGCLGLITLAASGIVSALRRSQKRGRLQPPPGDARIPRTFWLLTAPLLVLYPLTGLSFLVMLAIERLWLAAKARPI